MWEYNYSNELYHTGVKGMKWGVRRYQNYDGSYTRAGMKRFNSSLESYNKADSRYKNAKNSGSSKTEMTNARMQRKTAKKQLNKDYKHLRQDKLGDKGKELYSKGHTITGDSGISNFLASAGTLSASVAAYNYRTGQLGDQKVTKWLAGVGAGAMTLAAAKRGVDEIQARKLRAYYNHTSKY